jgi:hypothetical protein
VALPGPWTRRRRPESARPGAANHSDGSVRKNQAHAQRRLTGSAKSGIEGSLGATSVGF